MAEEQSSLQPEDFRRLQQRQIQAVENCKEHLKKWGQFKDDYQSLQETLLELPEKVTHDVMVPFGQLAFMPGRLHHTNEILVLLGDNWFAMRSAKQAAEIAERRKKFVLEKLEACREQLKNLQAQAGFTEEFQEIAEEKSKFVEIKEECREEDEQGYQFVGNVRHRVARTPQWSKSQSAGQAEAAVNKGSQDWLWARLDELEREEVQEEAEEEMKAAHLGGPPDVESACKEHSQPSEDSQPLTQRITFQHTKGTGVTAVDEDSQQAMSTTIRHPGDIHRHYSHLGEQPLLTPDEGVKWSRELEEVKPIPTRQKEKEEARTITPTPLSVFSGVVTERPTTTSLDKETAAAVQVPTRKVSKFKASRQKT